MIFEKHGDTAKDPFNFHADPHWQKIIRIQVTNISLRFTAIF